MRKNINCKKAKFITLSILIMCVLCSLILLLQRNIRLSEKQIFELRDRYPICESTSPANATSRKMTLEEYLNNGVYDSFIYGEVIGEYTLYYKNISSGHEVIDDKMKQNGLGVFEFYEYTVSVIEDTEGRYQKGDIITITDNMMSFDCNPQLLDGMRVVVPVMQNEDKPSRNWFGPVGMYYVTENGFAISAYEEEGLSNTVYSGLRVNILLEELKNLIE